MTNLSTTSKQNTMGQNRKIFYKFRIIIMICLTVLLTVGITEYLSQYISEIIGIIFYAIMLFGLIVLASLANEQAQRNFLIALGLIPVIRIICIAFPITLALTQFMWYLVISIPILVAIISIMGVMNYSLNDVGINVKDPILQLLIAAGGFCLGTLGFIFIKPVAWNDTFSLLSTLFPALILLIATGFIEELAFRGVMQRAAVVLGSYDWIYIAAIYSMLQIQYLSILSCIFSLGTGLFLGWMVKKTRSIIGVSLAHGFINIGFYLVYPHIF